MRNPLQPRKAQAPKWDPNATASGVYVSNSMSLSGAYAAMIAEDDGSVPLLVGIDATDLQKIPDPQIIDLLQEPYDEYRCLLLDWIRTEFGNQRLAFREEGLSKEDARIRIGSFFEFSKRFLMEYYAQFRSVIIRYTGKYAEDKVWAANAILSNSESWRPLTLFHRIYGIEAWNHIWAWLAWGEEREESIYSSQRFYCLRQTSPIPDEIVILAGKMFYFDFPVRLDHLTRVCRWDENIEQETILWENRSSRDEVFHGTSSLRFNQAFPELFPIKKENLDNH